MIYRLGALVWLLAVATMLLYGFADKPIPRHKPDGNPAHDGQPEFCINVRHGNYAANCECMANEAKHCNDNEEPEEPIGPDSPQCKTWCRKDHCGCGPVCG